METENIQETDNGNVNETETDLSKFEQNLTRETEDNEKSKMLELLNKQDVTITQLKAEIKNLKDLNMSLALSAGTKDAPQNAVDALNNAFAPKV